VLHIALHLLVPLAMAMTLYRSHWIRAFVVLILTMAVDLDHLLANPIYDPNRCSIDFHPLHSYPAIAAYGFAMLLPLARLAGRGTRDPRHPSWTLHLVGTGLIIHMALDAGDCWL
jgi:hypothetical protein